MCHTSLYKRMFFPLKKGPALCAFSKEQEKKYKIFKNLYKKLKEIKKFSPRNKN